MLTGLELWHLVAHIIPVYFIVLLGYGSVRIGLLQPLHLPGISRYVAMIGIPFYAFYLLAFDDPYQTSFKLVGADVLQKAVALTLGALWWKLSPTGSIDNLIDFFMLATLPNTVLVADSLLQPLYGDKIQQKVVTIILLQCFIWYNLTIALYELRGILLSEMAEQKLQSKEGEIDLSEQKPEQLFSRRSAISIPVSGGPGSGDHHDSDLNDSKRSSQGLPSDTDFITRSSSAPPRISALGKVFPAYPQQLALAQAEGREDFLARNVSRMTDSYALNTPTAAEINSASTRSLNFSGDRGGTMKSSVELGAPTRSHEEPPQISNRVVTIIDVEADQASSPGKRSTNGLLFAGRVILQAVNRLKYAPLTYGSVTGFIYSLFAFKYHWTMPYSVYTSMDLISGGALGLALFILGTTWASSGKLILCGWRRMLWGMFVRFIISPFIVIATGAIVGLKGSEYRFAILQAAIPQGIISFVLAKEYGLHAEEFATAVIAQLLIFVPIAIVYYVVLDSV